MRWIAVLCFILSGCNSQTEPTAISFGDSVSKPRDAYARHDLCELVDYRHNSWNDTGIDLCGSNFTPYASAQFLNGSINDGCSETELPAMKAEFAEHPHFTVVVFTAGLHDFQGASPTNKECGGYTRERFYRGVEALAEQAEQHADYVIWVNTPDIVYQTDDAIAAGIQNIINPIGDEIAREHGFYIAEMNVNPIYHLHNDIHYTDEGYHIMGDTLAACVQVVLENSETPECHH